MCNNFFSADVCVCESDIDFAAKLWCLRQSFDIILADQGKRRSIIQAGRNMIASLLRQDKKAGMRNGQPSRGQPRLAAAAAENFKTATATAGRAAGRF